MYEYSCLPLFSFLKTYIELIDIFEAEPINGTMHKLRDFLLKDYFHKNCCKYRKCYACKNFANDFAVKVAEDIAKAKRKEDLIAHKKYLKQKRYQKLSEKTGQNFNIELARL